MTFAPLGLVLGVILSSVVPAAAVQAQSLDSPAAKPPLAAALRKMTSSCKTELARFCPARTGPASARGAAICLRPYRSDASLRCRSALAAIRD